MNIIKGNPVHNIEELSVGEDIVLEVIGGNKYIFANIKKINNYHERMDFVSYSVFSKEDEEYFPNKNNYKNIGLAPYEFHIFKASNFFIKKEEDEEDLKHLYKHLAVNTNNKEWFNELCIE
jgi:hypothetical protein